MIILAFIDLGSIYSEILHFKRTVFCSRTIYYYHYYHLWNPGCIYFQRYL